MILSPLPFFLQECLSKMIVEIEDIFLRLADSGDILKARVTLESFQRGLAGMGVSLGEGRREEGAGEREGKREIGVIGIWLFVG